MVLTIFIRFDFRPEDDKLTYRNILSRKIHYWYIYPEYYQLTIMFLPNRFVNKIFCNFFIEK